MLATWAPDKGLDEHRVGLLISIEGADPILEPKQFEEWYERGVRAVGLAWMGTRYAGGISGSVNDYGPLTGLGRELLDVLADLNVILDLSHMAEESFFESLDRYEGPIIASHSNARKFSDTPRQLTDVMIRRLAERDGVMGIPLYNRFLKPDWTPRSGRKAEVTLEGFVAAAIDHVCQITGSARHVGIGSDLDGGFGLQSSPAEIDTIADELQIGDLLLRRGYASADVEGILSGNFLRIMRRSLPD